MSLSLIFYFLVVPLVTPLSAGPSLQIQDREGCGLSRGQDVEIDPKCSPRLQLRDSKNDQPRPHLEAKKLNLPSNGGWWQVPPIGHPATLGDQRAEDYPLQHPGAPGMIYGGCTAGDPYRGVNGFGTGRWFGARRPRQSDTASFFHSLDENADGVLAEDEIREFVQEVGGSTLDDHSEISGGVSTVMGRLDTDSQKGIGLKELSSWINRFESILTVEEAADWVRYAVQLPEDVAETFRSNSISGYDFVDLLNYDGQGLLFDLGLKRSDQKRIIKAIEIRLLGLGDEPPAPRLHPPSYLGDGKARIAWSTAEIVEDEAVPSSEHPSTEKDIDQNTDEEGAARGDGVTALVLSDVSCRMDEGSNAGDGGKALVGANAPTEGTGGPTVSSTGSGSGAVNECTERASGAASGKEDGRRKEGGSSLVDTAQTFPVHKYVLQRSCLGCHVASASSPAVSSPAVATVAVSASDVRRGLGDSAADGGWVTVHEANIDSTSTSMVFMDSGLDPGKVYAYRLRAWNRVGHSEASFVRLSTPPAPSPWAKPLRLISPWLPSRNSSTAPGSQAGTGNALDTPFNVSDEIPGIGDMDWAWAMEAFRVAWLILSWVWWGVRYSLSAANAILVLVGVSANLMRLRAAYGDEGTGAPARRNWAGLLLWKLNHVFTRNRLVCNIAEGVNTRLERLVGTPSPPARGIHRQESFRISRDASSPQWSAGSVSSRWSSETRRDWSPTSAGGFDHREDRAGLSRIEEEYVGMGVDGGWLGPRDTAPGSVRSWTDGPADESIPASRLRSVTPSVASGTDRLQPREPSGLHNRSRRQSPPNRIAWAETPQRRSGDSDELISPPEVSRAGRRTHSGTGAGTGGFSGLGLVSMLSSRTAGMEHSGGRVTIVSRGREWLGRGNAVSSRAETSTRDSDDDVVRRVLERESWGRAVGISRSRDSRNDDRENRLAGGGRGSGVADEVPAPPILRRSMTSGSRLTMHWRKSSLSRLALGLKKGEVYGRDGWLKEFEEAQVCFSCRERFKPVTRPRHHCSRCHRVFCGRHGFTSHPPVTPCSIPGECVCDICIGSVSGSIRSTAAGEDLTMQAASTTVSDMGLISSGRRFSFGHLRRLRFPGSRTRIYQASTFSAEPHEVASAAAAVAPVPTDSSAETASPSEVSPAPLPRDASREDSIHESRVGGQVGGDSSWTLRALRASRRATT